MNKFLFFDNASTTRCCEEAAQLVRRFATDDYGNPSSVHAMGRQSAQAIREARAWFAQEFRVEPEQVIFTGGGTEADNLAVYGVAMDAVARLKGKPHPRVLFSAIEHPAVRNTARSLAALDVDVQSIAVDARGQIDRAAFEKLLTPETALVSIMTVNNIVGAVLPVEELARVAKARVPGAVFHTDAVQAFGRVPVAAGGAGAQGVDLVSISAHKIEGPKGVGALIVLNRALMKEGLRPLVWGGEQEGGFRSGTQNAGLIAGFRAAAEMTLAKREAYAEHARGLRERLRAEIARRPALAGVRWNSPEGGVAHIVSLSVPGLPSGPLAKLLEERGCLVSTGSACSSKKVEPDPVLTAMGLGADVASAAIRVSFCDQLTTADVETFAQALDESIALMKKLLGVK